LRRTRATTTLEKYGTITQSDDPERLVTSFTLNEGYTLRAVPGLFKKRGMSRE
jgi:hypothetical protein